MSRRPRSQPVNRDSGLKASFQIVCHHLDTLTLPGGIDHYLLRKLLTVSALGAIALTFHLAAEEGIADTVISTMQSYALFLFLLSLFHLFVFSCSANMRKTRHNRQALK